MVSHTLKLALVGAGIASVIGLSSITLYLKSSSTNTEITSETKTKSIPEFLKEDGLQLIKDASDSAGTNKGGDFVDAHQNAIPQGVGAIPEGESKKAQRSNVPQEFKTNCSNNGSKQVVDQSEDIYQKVKSYCTKPLPVTPTKR